MRNSIWLLASVMVACCACQSAAVRDEQARAAVSVAMKKLLQNEIDVWLQESRTLQAAAPLPSGRGWDETQDAEGLKQMREHWHRSRTAYERIEGAIAPLFPESDLATDARYDDFLSVLGPDGDRDAFDSEGVIGMHAIERILWAQQIPSEVLDFEKGVPGYRVAAYPKDESEARAFKTKLAARMVSDVAALRAQIVPLELDVAFVFRGLLDLAAEQAEKVDRAATGQEESRYAQTTLEDLRDNRKGCEDAYRLFRPWLMQHENGAAIDAKVQAAFVRLAATYDSISGHAIPRPPANMSRLEPSAEHLRTPFGVLFQHVRRESDDAFPGSLRASLLEVAQALELPKVVAR
jgi:iron uptake system component EfeO